MNCRNCGRPNREFCDTICHQEFNLCRSIDNFRRIKNE